MPTTTFKQPNRLVSKKSKKAILLKIISKNKQVIMVMFLILSVVGIYLLTTLSKQRNLNTQKSTSVSPTPIASRVNSRGLTSDSLEPVNIYPKPGKVQIGDTKDSIAIFFETAVDLKTITVKSTPFIKFKITSLPDFPYRAILKPVIKWKPDTNYKIIIKEGVQSKDGLSYLKDDIILEYQVVSFELPKGYLLPR